MTLEASDVIVGCENVLQVQLRAEVRLLVFAIVQKYQVVVNDGGWRIDEVREWCVRATEAYAKFRDEGNDVEQYQSALKIAQESCEAEFERWQQDRI